MQQRRTAGFTLVEMMAVVGIAGMAVATASASLNQALPAWRARQAAMEIATGLRAARARAMLEHTDTIMPFDRGHCRYTFLARTGPERLEVVGGEKIAYLPRGVEFRGPQGEEPITLDPPGSEDEAAAFSTKGMLKSDSIPGYVYLGVPSRDVYWRVAVNSIGIVRMERWNGAAWQ